MIRDEGGGSDTSVAHRAIEPEDFLRASGRGLLLMKSFMDEVTFNRVGNEVTLVKRRSLDSPFSSSLSRETTDGAATSVTSLFPENRAIPRTPHRTRILARDATSTTVVENAFRQVREAADRDPLTGLANRRSLDQMLGHFLEERERTGQPLLLVIADLDHFKQVNDTWGHAIGDQALTQFAALLQNQCRSVDLVARFGGEEFVVLLPGTNLGTVTLVAERLRNNVRLATPVELGQYCLTASFGVAEAAPDETASQVLKRADLALYQTKSLGRDRVEVESSWKSPEWIGEHC